MIYPTINIKLVGVVLSLVVIGCTPPQSNSSANQKAETTQTVAQTSAETCKDTTCEISPVTLTPAANWQENNHIHGIAVHPDNPAIFYVATHHGLLQRSEAGEWFWVGSDRSDYMGFTAHPTDSKRFYSSGHPPTGGNLGFRISENQGEDWKILSMPGVDFHALAIAPSNPEFIYGWASSGEEGFFLSQDEGKTWKQIQPIGLDDFPFHLVVDPQNPQRVFATTRIGLYESTDSGSNWNLVPNTEESPVAGLALVKENDKIVMYGFRLLQSDPGIYRSSDNGTTWEPLGKGTEGLILYIAIASSNPQIIYAVNNKNTIFQSQDGGKTWKVLS